MDCDATSPKITRSKAQRERGRKQEKEERKEGIPKTLTNQN
jgi:hypothetical protein